MDVSPPRPPSSSRPGVVDQHIGSRIRQRRLLLDLSQQSLALALGVTFQQIQKYEKGQNRISASRLWEISHILQSPIIFFFEGLDNQSISSYQIREYSDDIDLAAPLVDPMAKKETHELIRAYYSIKDPIVRKKIISLVQSLGGNDGASNEL